MTKKSYQTITTKEPFNPTQHFVAKKRNVTVIHSQGTWSVEFANDVNAGNDCCSRKGYTEHHVSVYRKFHWFNVNNNWAGECSYLTTVDSYGFSRSKWVLESTNQSTECRLCFCSSFKSSNQAAQQQPLQFAFMYINLSHTGNEHVILIKRAQLIWKPLCQTIIHNDVCCNSVFDANLENYYVFKVLLRTRTHIMDWGSKVFCRLNQFSFLELQNYVSWRSLFTRNWM